MRQCLLGTAETHRELATCDQQQRLTATDVDSRSADLLAAVSTTSTALHSNPEITQRLLVETSYAGQAGPDPQIRTALLSVRSRGVKTIDDGRHISSSRAAGRLLAPGVRGRS